MIDIRIFANDLIGKSSFLKGLMMSFANDLIDKFFFKKTCVKFFVNDLIGNCLFLRDQCQNSHK